ncbi:MAG: IctB family putative bicarbonate transporter [Thainema sp.]
MNSVLQRVTLSTISLEPWRGASLIHRGLFPFRQWRQGSWLLQWADAIAVLLAACVFGLAPYVSTTLIGVLLLCCAAFWALLTLTDEAESGLSTPIHLLVLLYWGVATAATALSPVRSAAISGWVELTLFLVFFALLARCLRSQPLRTGLIVIYLLTAMIVSIYGLRQWFFGAEALATWVDPESPLAETTRVYSYLGNPNLLAGYLVPAIPFSMAALFAWRSWLQKALALLLLVVNSLCLILTFSRGGWLGFVAAGYVMTVLIVWWWLPRMPYFWRRWALPMVLGGSAAFIVVAVAALEPLRDRVLSIFAGRDDSSNNFRINVWMAAIDMIKDRPVLGIGPGHDAFNQVYPLYQQARYSALSAYSIPLEIAVEMGLIGLAAFGWLVLTAIIQGLVQVNRLRQSGQVQGYWLLAAIAAMIGLLIHGLVDTVWYRPQINTLWWLCLAIVASYWPKSELHKV